MEVGGLTPGASCAVGCSLTKFGRVSYGVVVGGRASEADLGLVGVWGGGPKASGS